MVNGIADRMGWWMRAPRRCSRRPRLGAGLELRQQLAAVEKRAPSSARSRPRSRSETARVRHRAGRAAAGERKRRGRRQQQASGATVKAHCASTPYK